MDDIQPPPQALTNVIDPTGEVVAIPNEQVAEALQSRGFKAATPEALAQHFKEEEFGSLPQQALTAVEGVGEGVAGPLFTAAERATGLTTPENMLARREVNPIAHGLGQGAGLIGSAMTGIGEAPLLEGAGKAVVEGLGLSKPVGVMASAASGASKMAAEMALMQAGDETSKMLMNDPNTSLQSAITSVGLSALIGAGGGGALGAVNPLWKATVGEKLGKFLEDFRGRIAERTSGVEPTPGMVSEELAAPAQAAAEPRPKFDPFTKKVIEGETNAIPEAAANKPKFDPFTKKAIESTPEAAAIPEIIAEQMPQKLTPGMKAADFLVDKAVKDFAGKSIGAAVGGAAGAIVGHKWIGAIVGERMLGPLFDSILPSMLKPIMENAPDSAAFKNAIEYSVAVIRGEKLMTDAAKGVFKPGAEVLASKSIPTERDRSRLVKRMDEINANPEGALKEPDKFGSYMPGHAGAKGQAVGAALEYLHNAKPMPRKTTLMDKAREPSPHEIAEYNKVLDLAQQPALAFKKIKDGTITSRDINMLKSVYPAFYKQAVSKLHDQLVDHLSKEKTIPYTTRIGLAKFFGEPLDSTMQPASLMSIQQSLMQSQPQPKPMASTPSKSGALKKASSTMQTQQQASEARHTAQF